MGILIQRAPALPRLIGMLLWLALLLPAAKADSDSRRSLSTAPEVAKASCVRLMARETRWPDSAFVSADAPFVIGLLQGQHLQEPLTRLFDKERIHGRAVTIRTVKSAGEAGNCHLLFVGNQNAESLRRELRQLQGRAVLTISEQWDGLDAGAMITVGIVAEKLRFDLAVAATEAAGLKVSADVVELSLSQGKRKGPTP